MAVIVLEGFEGFTGGDNTTLMNGDVWASGSSVSSNSSSTDTRFSYGRSMQVFGSNRLRSSISNRTKVFQGAAIKKTVGATATSEPIFEVYDGATLQCWVGYDSSNRQINVYRGSGTTNLIASSTTNVTPVFDNWFFIEWSPTIHSSAGAVDVRINGSSVISATALNTQASGAAQITIAALFAHASSERMLVDDYYCFDDQGSSNNTFNGDSRIYTLFADTDASVQFTRSTGSVNADLVDDLGDIDDDSTYNASGTAGHVDSFNIEQVPVSAVVSAIEVRIVARKDDATTRTVRSRLERAGNTANGTTRTLGTTYTQWGNRYDNDPTDSSSLTAAKVNAMHLQYEMVS